MKNFNQFMEAVLIAKVMPTSDAVAPVETCDACGQNKPKDKFNSATDDFMKQMGFNDDVDAEGTEEVMQPDDNVGETGEIEAEGESTSNVELNCLGEEGLEVTFNGLKFVLPKDVVEAIKGYSSDEGHEEGETEDEHEEHEENETPAEETSEHAEGGSEPEETEEEDGKKNPFTESKKKGKAVNPWAVCTKSVGQNKTDKFENCVLDIKKKNKIKK